MDETRNDELNLRICRLIEFYHGGVTYNELQNMPIPEFWEIEKNAIKLSEEAKREAARK